MSLVPVTMYTIVCDECGRAAFDEEEIIAWSDETSALDVLAEREDWSFDPTGKIHRCSDHNPFCERCGKDAGEFCGERDFLCHSCFDEAESA